MRIQLLAGAALALGLVAGQGALARPKPEAKPAPVPAAPAAEPDVGPHGFPISKAGPPPMPIPADCDRACLEGIADQITAAMVAHNPASLPLSKSVRYTEGGSVLKVGDGFWATASGAGGYRHYFADPAVGQVVVMRTMTEGPARNGLLMALRARVELGRIQEIETVFYKKGSGPAWNDAGIDNLDKSSGPPPQWLETVPAARRMSRMALINAANDYFQGLQRNDGRGYYPFTPTCNRLENGVATTNNSEIQKGQPFQPFSFSCKEQFSTGYYGVVSEIGQRRWVIADPERGVAVAVALFKHAGTTPRVHLTNGQDYDMALFSKPSSILIVEAFRIVDGKIDLVEAVGASAAYGMSTGWSGGLSGD
jgi:hypothetical protein